MGRLKTAIVAIDFIIFLISAMAFDSESWIPKIVALVSALVMVAFIPFLKKAGEKEWN